MKHHADFLKSKGLSFCSGIIIATAFCSFAYANFVGFQHRHEWTLLLFCFSEALTAVFVIFRSDPKTVSNNNFDWIVAIGGTFAPLLMRPAGCGMALAPFAKYAIIAGVIIQVGGLISLNRSIALVAAKREIKKGGLYRFVRHPLYSSYFLTFSGYVLMNTTLENFIVYFLTLGLIILRIFKEEEHLAIDSVYREYMHKVRYRLIPFVY